MFKSLINLTKDVATIALAPVEIAIDTTRAITKPVAKMTEDVVDEVKEVTNTKEQ